MSLFTLSNPKMRKGEKQGWLSAVLHLSPAQSGGVSKRDGSTLNTCPAATAGCQASCLNTAGHGGIFKPDGTNVVLDARRRRTEWYARDPEDFIRTLIDEVTLLKYKAAREGLKLCVRPNGTSDIPALGMRLATFHRDVQFYDYTKLPKPWARTLPNYDLTFSRSETNTRDCLLALAAGINVAVVFDVKKGAALPTKFLMTPVDDGDETDLRFLDRPGRIIGLRAKGRAKQDQTGFVVRTSLNTAQGELHGAL